MKNLFCNVSDLKNEADVETYFVDRLLKYLDFSDEEIALKKSISEYTIGKGRKKILYRPDYVIKIKNIPTMVIDAKSPHENISDWELQCSSYCLEINKEYDYDPVEYYLLSNGIQTSLYKWNKRKPLLSLRFEDFEESKTLFKELMNYISKNSIHDKSNILKETLDSEKFGFEKVSLSELSSKFQKLHQEIWQIEKKGPGAAFQELIKIFFIKIRKDKDLHKSLGKSPKPKYADVTFSQHWISAQSENKNPINDILFKNLIDELEQDIMEGRKKRFFEKDDQINLSPDTIKKIVKEMEHVDLYGMEDDVHGRMFETFLDATTRGKDIGQFFTPRDIVDLMVTLGSPKTTKTHTDKVLDACCGSGGFLISALSKMLKQISLLKGLSSKEREELVQKVKLQSIYGVDAGSDPAMYKIARMNMYLHGDGGSNIFYADSLNKEFGRIGGHSHEVDKQLKELKDLISVKETKFDLILSNPPFSLQYSRENKKQADILNQYELSRDRLGGKITNKLNSSVMFIERYKDLVSNSGKIIAVIDDSILSGDSHAYVRRYIRTHFIVEAIISLPGDTFKRAKARVKTSIIILRKKIHDEEQTDIFMASSIYLGLEPKIAKRIGLGNIDLEKEKEKEKEIISNAFNAYLDGKDSKFVIPFENCLDRLDVKYCINDRGRKAETWYKRGFNTCVLGDILTPQDRKIFVQENKNYPLLIVDYSGNIADGEILEGAETSYSKLSQVRTWDLLISNMGFGRGAISIVPPYHQGKYVSSEYTILTAPTKEHVVFYWNLLRTKEILGDVLSSTTGMNRGRIKWEIIKKVTVPEYEGIKEIKNLVKEMERYWKATEEFQENKNKFMQMVSNTLEVDGEDSYLRWLSFKPPE